MSSTTTTTDTASQCTIGPILASNGRICINLARMMLEGVEAARFARLAEGRKGPVNSNHPAFVFGHLALYPARLCEMLGDGDSAQRLAPPPDWAERFGAGKECVDDPDGTIYPSMDEIVKRYVSGYESLCELVMNTPDDVLSRENPSEPMRKRLGLQTLGAAANFLLNGHHMTHLGQISAWRRMEGLGSAIRM